MRKESTIDDAEIKRQVECARALKEEEIYTSAPDAHVMSEEKWANARPFREVLQARKQSINLHVDAHVLEWYQRQGEGCETCMSQALRLHMEAEQKAALSR